MTMATIATAAGLHRTTVTLIMRSPQRRMTRIVSDAILGVQVGSPPPHTVSGLRSWMAAGEARDLLTVIHRYSGCTWPQIHRTLGLAPHRGNPIEPQDKLITYRTHLRVVTLYRLLVRAGRVPVLLDLEEAVS
jgi:hypothetical protein